MVLPVEPTFVFPGRGAIGIEDSYLVTKEDIRLKFDHVTSDSEGYAGDPQKVKDMVLRLEEFNDMSELVTHLS